MIADRSWVAGEVVEVAAVLVIPAAQRGKLRGTVVAPLLVEWGEDAAIVLGDGSRYRKFEDGNLEAWPDLEGEAVHYLARRPIRAGEELTVHIGG